MITLLNHDVTPTDPAIAPVTTAEDALLELHSVSCMRGTRRLFVDINAVVRSGQLLRVQGANGAGKTTLLRVLCGLSLPDVGEVRWCGKRLHADREGFHRELIYLGHAAALKDDLSACENLLAASVLGGQRHTTAQVISALAAAGLHRREHLPARSLSQGQRRRVGLARLLLGAATKLWVLDEPFNALDAAATQWLSGLLTRQLRNGGIVVLSSHQPVAIDASLSHVCLTL